MRCVAAFQGTALFTGHTSPVGRASHVLLGPHALFDPTPSLAADASGHRARWATSGSERHLWRTPIQNPGIPYPGGEQAARLARPQPPLSAKRPLDCVPARSLSILMVSACRSASSSM
jgi:hypothetical protein